MPCITWTIGMVTTPSQYGKINQFVDQFSSKVASTQFNPFTRIFRPGSCSSVLSGVCRLTERIVDNSAIKSSKSTQASTIVKSNQVYAES